MTTIEAVSKIMNATKFADIVDLGRYKEDYRELVKLVHVDKGGNPEATAKLNDFKTIYEKGIKYEDEAGEYYSNGYWIKRKSTDLLEKSYKNWVAITMLNVSHLSKYIPSDGSIIEGQLTFNFGKRCIPLPLALEQGHVRWILSRILEFVMMLETQGYVHGGINPDSVFIDPENHGIMITSFYYLTKIGTHMRSVNGKYKSWYPSQLFKNKIAHPLVDIELAKKTAIYLLGDKSGVGVRLKKTHNKELLEFLMTQDYNAYFAYEEYRALLKKNFESKFHILNI
jgi:serine/threonine protein kinase